MVEDLAKVRGELKKWEAEFLCRNEGRKPEKQDIAAASKDVQLLYRRYAQLKRESAASSFSSSLSPTPSANTLSIPNSTRPLGNGQLSRDRGVETNEDALSAWGGSAAPALTPLGAVVSRDANGASSSTKSSSPWSSRVASKLLAGANLDSLARKSLTPSRGAVNHGTGPEIASGMRGGGGGGGDGGGEGEKSNLKPYNVEVKENVSLSSSSSPLSVESPSRNFFSPSSSSPFSSAATSMASKVVEKSVVDSLTTVKSLSALSKTDVKFDEEKQSLVRVKKEAPVMPENFFVDETPATPTAPTAPATPKSKIECDRAEDRSSSSPKTTPVLPGREERKSTLYDASERLSTTNTVEGLTFEEEWQFGRGGGEGGGGKSGDLKADGDRVNRRGVKRGPRKAKKAKTLANGKSRVNEQAAPDASAEQPDGATVPPDDATVPPDDASGLKIAGNGKPTKRIRQTKAKKKDDSDDELEKVGGREDGDGEETRPKKRRAAKRKVKEESDGDGGNSAEAVPPTGEAAFETSAEEAPAPAKRPKIDSASGGVDYNKSVFSRGGGGGGGGNWGRNAVGSIGGGAGKSIQSRNENFVRLNMKLKKYRKKGQKMGGEQFKRQQWKQKYQEKMKNANPNYGTNKCFKCGQEGHWANKCKAQGRAPIKLKDEEDKLKDMLNDGKQEEVDKNTDSEQHGKIIAGVFADFRMTYAAGWNSELTPPPRCAPLLETGADGSLPPLPKFVHAALKKMGHDSFRTGQEEVVKRVLCGLPTLLVLPTGAGKSLCYQLPAHLYAVQREKPCITLVICPLVALMEDQVKGLSKIVKGACLHHGMSQTQKDKVVAMATEGEIQLLLLSPEAVVYGASQSNGWMSRLPAIAFAAIDEVHCVSEWSHNFRPSYLQVCKVLKEKLGVDCLVGLTATATRRTAVTVAKHLGIRPDCAKNAILFTSAVPHNLVLSISTDANRENAIVELLQDEPFSGCDSVIVYCIRREQTERIASLLRTVFQEKNTRRRQLTTESRSNKKTTKKKAEWGEAECYHAGLSTAQRKRVQTAFMKGDLRIVVATVAFGMGLDKSDLRAVLHYSMPKNLESYVQEIGRAGRDGKTAYCHLFLDNQNSDDLKEQRRHIYANSVDHATVKKLVTNIFVSCKCRRLQEQLVVVERRDDSSDLSAIAEKNAADAAAAAVSSSASIDPVETGVVSDSSSEGRGSEACVEAKAGEKNVVGADDIPDGMFDEEMEEEVVAAAASEEEQQKQKNIVSSPHEGSHSARSSRACAGHEVAVPISRLVSQLDLKEENIVTLLSYLELHPSHSYVQPLISVSATCHVRSYKGGNLFAEASRFCPPLALALTRARARHKGFRFEDEKVLNFPYVDVARQMGLESRKLKYALYQLEWLVARGNPGQTVGKSGFKIEFSEPSLHFLAPGDLDDEETDDVIAYLEDRCNRQERIELSQLRETFETLKRVSYSHHRHVSQSLREAASSKGKGGEREEDAEEKGSEEEEEREGEDDDDDDDGDDDRRRDKDAAIDEEEETKRMRNGEITTKNVYSRSQTLKDSLVDYFERTTTNSENNGSPASESAAEEPKIRADVASFLSVYSDQDIKFTGRAIARIFHGIDSPNFPANVWGRNRRFWRANLDKDFHQIRKVATTVLLGQ